MSFYVPYVYRIIYLNFIYAYAYDKEVAFTISDFVPVNKLLCMMLLLVDDKYIEYFN